MSDVIRGGASPILRPQVEAQDVQARGVPRQGSEHLERSAITEVNLVAGTIPHGQALRDAFDSRVMPQNVQVLDRTDAPVTARSDTGEPNAVSSLQASQADSANARKLNDAKSEFWSTLKKVTFSVCLAVGTVALLSALFVPGVNIAVAIAIAGVALSGAGAMAVHYLLTKGEPLANAAMETALVAAETVTAGAETVQGVVEANKEVMVENPTATTVGLVGTGALAATALIGAGVGTAGIIVGTGVAAYAGGVVLAKTSEVISEAAPQIAEKFSETDVAQHPAAATTGFIAGAAGTGLGLAAAGFTATAGTAALAVGGGIIGMIALAKTAAGAYDLFNWITSQAADNQEILDGVDQASETQSEVSEVSDDESEATLKPLNIASALQLGTICMRLANEPDGEEAAEFLSSLVGLQLMATEDPDQRERLTQAYVLGAAMGIAFMPSPQVPESVASPWEMPDNVIEITQ